MYVHYASPHPTRAPQPHAGGHGDNSRRGGSRHGAGTTSDASKRATLARITSFAASVADSSAHAGSGTDPGKTSASGSVDGYHALRSSTSMWASNGNMNVVRGRPAS